MIVVNDLQLLALAVGGLPSVGPGIAGDRSWLVSAGALMLLAVLAWWTMRPARRASRAELRRARRTDRAATRRSGEDLDRPTRSNR